MSFFGLNESEQKNITQNSISNSVRNSSSNISRNTVVSSQNTTAEVNLNLRGANIDGCVFRSEAVASSTMDQDVQVLSESHTSYDTSLTNNVTNTLKNAVKQKTPGLYNSGLFSSQVNNQLNSAVNLTKNNVSNSFYKNRKNLVSSDQTTSALGNFDLSESTIKCYPGQDASFFGANASSSLQNNFLSQSLDEESAKSSISTTFKNDLSNTATQTGGDIVGAIATLLIIIVLIGFGKKDDSNDDKKMISTTTRKFLVFILSFLFMVGIIIILRDEDNYEKDSDDIDCESGYTKDPSVSTEIFRKCADKLNKLSDWREIRNSDNFSRTNTSVEIDGSSGDQYQRVENSVSLRGVHRERGSDGTFIDVDYTRLNKDPYSDYDCIASGMTFCGNPGCYEAEGGTNSEHCRTIEEDFKWEELIKKSCGCCGCDPEKIGYMKEWLENNEGKECYLDNSRELGVFCDKNIDMIQPGSGYETGQNYSTTCRNPKNDSRPGMGDGKCKKLNSDGTTSDIDDDDDDASIKVSLISETDCRGLSNDLKKNAVTCVTDEEEDRIDDTNFYKTGCCFQEAPEVDWSTPDDSQSQWDPNFGSLFGKVDNTGALCSGGTAITPATAATTGCAVGLIGGPAGCVAGAGIAAGVVTLTGGICPENCTKADSCRIGYLNSLKDEIERARRDDDDINSIQSSCPAECEYQIKGVQELRVTDVPDNHIEDPDNIYTIKKESGENVGTPRAGMQPVEYIDNGGFLNEDIDSVWQASSFIHHTDKPTRYSTGFTVHENCSTIADSKEFKTYNNLGTPNNLCECKFRRLPSCIKNKDGIYKTTMGCEDNSDPDEADCMVCKNSAGLLKNPIYGSKLKDEAWNNIGIVSFIYIILCLLLYVF